MIAGDVGSCKSVYSLGWARDVGRGREGAAGCFDGRAAVL